MPAAKVKGGSVSHRYRPASDYDDAALAQKREYWRNKKREQRARLSEQRKKPAQDNQRKKLRHLCVPGEVNPISSDSFPALSPPIHEPHKSSAQRGNTVDDTSVEAAGNKEKSLQTTKDNNAIPHFPSISHSIIAKAVEGNTDSLKYPTERSVCKVTLPTSTGSQFNISSSVPPIMVTIINNVSSAKTTLQPCVRGTSVLKTQSKAQVGGPIQLKLLPTNVTRSINFQSPHGPASIKTEDKITNTAPQSGTKSALVTTQKVEGIGRAQSFLESEEERAAKRREQWRIKKREQRAKLAAQIAKVRERMPPGEVTFRRLTAQKTGLVASSIFSSPQPFLRGVGRRQCPIRVKMSSTSIKRETDKLQSGKAIVSVDLKTDQMKAQHLCGNKVMPTDIAFDIASAKKTPEPLRKLPSYTYHCNVTRGIARCKTPRQRLIETQKNLMNQRNLRCKMPLMASVLSTRGMPKIDSNDTPDQIIAKRREYWRIKKREQRAKLSVEMKTRFKEKDSMMRRVKRYQQIIDEMRKARALTHSTGSAVTYTTDTIGGFIKEDGTLTVNIPQSPKYQNKTGEKSDDKLAAISKSIPITQTQHQTNMKQRDIAPIRTNQLPSCPSQVKVSFPLAMYSVNKPPRIKPPTPLEITTVPNSQSPAVQSVSHLTLTHPQSSQNSASAGLNTGSNLDGCVMKLAISRSAPTLSVLSLDPGLTEEERMAKKREYWRIKKREQRAARAVRLKQGILQVKTNADLQRRKAQRQEPPSTMQLSRNVTYFTENPQTVPNNTVHVVAHVNEIKQERESVPAADLNSQPGEAICPDIKPPAFPPALPTAQPEPDPSLSEDNQADSQATTLLVVASMKKLLEESLSTVTECKSEQTHIKVETVEDPSEDIIKPSLYNNFLEKYDMTNIAADFKLQIKNCQPDLLDQNDSSSLQLKNPLQISETFSPISTSSEVGHYTCEHSSQAPSNFTANLSVEPSDGPASPRRTQRLCTKKAGCQNCCSPEPPKLHHISATSLDQLQAQQQHCEQQRQAQKRWQGNNSPSAQKYHSVTAEQSTLTSLQKKREYWKLMKRQQRARLKARQKDRRGECSSLLFSRNMQTPGLILNTVKGVSQTKSARHPKSHVNSVAAEISSPVSEVLVVSETSCNAEQSPDKLPVTGREENNINVGLLQNITNVARNSDSFQELMPKSTIVDSPPSLPTLRPPENPLSSINLQPIESPGQSPISVFNPIKIHCAQPQSPTNMIQSSTKIATVGTMVPPKPIPGESEEDFLKRKREYWRIKKKEQRARKAIQEKRITPKRVSNSWKPVQPAHDLQIQTGAAQGFGQWVNSSEESEHLMSMSVDSHSGPFTFSEYTAQVEDESELLFDDYEDYNDEEGPLTESVWRSRYLMDHDPLNQLLVCMVCGELQYSHNLEGVKTHIDEAHPHTLTLEPGEKQLILEAWDEQVSQRERFFTSQLQQHGGTLAETHRN